ncbi:MAG: tyrosine--tRNA ligase [Oscillospiraceae bacterium]|nr:tyrosine--tRNA ligase [Oscillospiraceae bacterium]
MGVFEELKARGFVAQMTDEEKIRNLLENESVRFYIGFDPTADSLHVGSFVQMMVIAHMQRAGHVPIVLFGGGTGMIGDPTGKTDLRQMLTKEDIDHNIACFKEQMSAFIDFSGEKAIMVNNADWLLELNYVEFLRDVGVHFSVNRMLAAECYRQRLERGLSFFELNYMIMQSYDFLHLSRNYGCTMQLGGDDQWSNIIGGVELTRRADGREVYGMTFNLLLTSDGRKMGKTESGTVWLDAEKTAPYDFYQYWRNTDDADVIKCMKLLTFLPLEQIAEYEKLEGSELNSVKEMLAYEITKNVHGRDAAEKSRETARALFVGAADAANMPTASLKKADFDESGVAVADILVAAGLAKSKGEGKRLIEQGGVSVDDEKITDPFAKTGLQSFEKGHVVIKKGKKAFVKLVLS